MGGVNHDYLKEFNIVRRRITLSQVYPFVEEDWADPETTVDRYDLNLNGLHEFGYHHDSPHEMG
jgi:hypothetical protein